MKKSSKSISDIGCGVVVIGRNEGKRLETCLNSVAGYTDKLIYVDSGSVDGSVDMARETCATVIELDLTIPFTAARARNEGFRKLIELFPEINYVQFVDGDCEIHQGWLKIAVDFLEKNQNVAVAYGRLQERFPNRSVYNMLCDVEWDTPVGESSSCGGIAMIRASAFKQAGGFNRDLIAGEEPELCVRLRVAGWKIWRIDAEMAMHDASILRFSQWWTRSMRSGHAFAEGAYLHGAGPVRHWVREAVSPMIWGFALPLLAIMVCLQFGFWGLLILMIYPVQIFRIYEKGSRSPRINLLYATFLVLGKFPEMLGVVRFIKQKLLGGKKELIEYK